jgi:hypothetical protein
MPKLSAFGKNAGVMDMLKDLWHSIVERISESLEKLLGISREVAELGNEAVDIGYKLEEVGEVYGMNVKKGWNVPVNYEKGDIVCLKDAPKNINRNSEEFRRQYCGKVVGIDGVPGDIRSIAVKTERGNVVSWNPLEVELAFVGMEQKLGYKVEILAENVAKVGDELVVEKTAEDLCWKLFDRIMEGCGCEKKAVEYLEMVVEKYREKLEDMSKKAGWEKLPKGWTAESVKKFWDSLTGDVKHKVTKCIKLMDGKVDNPEAFCASLRDKVEGKTTWRGR